MATNLLAPTGLVWTRSLAGATTASANKFKILKTYSTAIAMGDLVQTGTSGNQGYVTLATTGTTTNLGVFLGVLPYYDTGFQGTGHGLLGSWPASGVAPSADVDCLVIDDPFAVYRIQYSGGPYLTSWRGTNASYASNGAPNFAGISTAYATGQATTSTLALRIIGVSGITGGPRDPANTNPWLEVTLNFANTELASGTGI